MHSHIIEQQNRISEMDLEEWLKTLVAEKNFPAAALAEAMIEDGYAAAEANILAVAAYIRYGDTALASLAKNEAGRDALGMINQYGLAAIAESFSRLDIETPLDPFNLNGNKISLGDRTISLRFLARHPRVAVFDNLLSDDECAALMDVGRARLQPDRVIDKLSGEDVKDDSTRSSYGTFVRHDEFDWLKTITGRIAELIGWPEAKLEDIALSRYQQGEQFLPHHDYFDTQGSNIETLLQAGQRIATLVIYLNDVTNGGGTLFSQVGYEIIPQRGSGVYFSYQRSDGTPDPTSLHGGNPVEEGEKWIATFWFVERNINRTKTN